MGSGPARPAMQASIVSPRCPGAGRWDAGRKGVQTCRLLGLAGRLRALLSRPPGVRLHRDRGLLPSWPSTDLKPHHWGPAAPPQPETLNPDPTLFAGAVSARHSPGGQPTGSSAGQGRPCLCGGAGSTHDPAPHHALCAAEPPGPPHCAHGLPPH